MEKRLIIVTAIAALSLAACIIGPKQDDPVVVRSGDADSSVDANAELASDSAASDTNEQAIPSPEAGGGGDGDAKFDGDAADARDGDAKSDGDAADARDGDAADARDGDASDGADGG